MSKFTLEITLGNAAMQSATDVTIALQQVADRIVDHYGDVNDLAGWDGLSGGIRDYNGNTVGRWEVSE